MQITENSNNTSSQLTVKFTGDKMSSSEIVDSGRFSGGRSNFSQTCSLLSQYLKTKGSFGDLTLGLTPKPEPQQGTMNLFPMTEKSAGAGRDEAQKKSDASVVKTAPMTIFYAGQVIVFDNFPANKAEEIMMLASKSVVAAPPQPLASDLPIARKNSLARFLEKRKDRITANAPYSKPVPAPAPVKAEPWLGLAPQVPLHMQRRRG